MNGKSDVVEVDPVVATMTPDSDLRVTDPILSSANHKLVSSIGSRVEPKDLEAAMFNRPKIFNEQ